MPFLYPTLTTIRMRNLYCPVIPMNGYKDQPTDVKFHDTRTVPKD